MPHKQRVAVCIPSGETWCAPMAFQSLCLGIHSAPQLEVIPFNVRGDDTAQGRNRLVRLALEAGAHWLLWLDADMIFPPDALAQLLAHDTSIVGADYRRRAPPFAPIGLLLHPDDPTGLPAFNTPQARAKTTGIAERAILGLGLLLVHARVFRKLPAPWFARTWTKEHVTDDNPDGFSTEDSYFCYCARQAGFHVMVDLDLTAQVQHIGSAVVPWHLPGAPDGPNEVAA